MSAWKEHDRREDYVAEHVADDPAHRPERGELGDVVEPDEQHAADDHLRRASVADQLQKLVEQERHDSDVQQVAPADANAEHAAYGIEH